jgi:hypothetical protein
MPYIVQPGREVHDGHIYVAGDVYPAMKGAIPELIADGVVLWVTVDRPQPAEAPAPPAEPVAEAAPPPKPEPKKPAAKKPAARKAVKR